MNEEHPETRWFPLTQDQHAAVLGWRGENHIYADWDSGYERLEPIPPVSHGVPMPEYDNGSEWRFRRVNSYIRI